MHFQGFSSSLRAPDAGRGPNGRALLCTRLEYQRGSQPSVEETAYGATAATYDMALEIFEPLTKQRLGKILLVLPQPPKTPAG